MIALPEMQGQLGNQMFQYASMRALALKHGMGIYYSKEYQISEVFKLPDIEVPMGNFSFYSEPGFSYTEIPLISKDMVLKGFFQSEKYFKDFEEEIKKDFTFKSPVFLDIESVDAISLHVRRGDYIKTPNYHPLCTMEYYKKALTLMPDEEVIVFSDDIPWCKDNFKGERFVFSEGRSNSQDLEYMSKCKHHIIANSSFSWWGAWLGSYNGITTAPKNWFGSEANLDTKDIIPEDWIVL